MLFISNYIPIVISDLKHLTKQNKSKEMANRPGYTYNAAAYYAAPAATPVGASPATAATIPAAATSVPSYAAGIIIVGFILIIFHKNISNKLNKCISKIQLLC